MPSSSRSFSLRQLPEKEALQSTSKRWDGGGSNTNRYTGGSDKNLSLQMEGLHINGGLAAAASMNKKRVMVVVDEPARARHAMIWALTHVANKGDLLTLLHVIPPDQDSSPFFSPYLASSLGSIYKLSRPEVEVEVLVMQGPKLATVTSQVKKLEVSVLVLGQKKPSTFLSCLCGISVSNEFVEQCIDGADCLTIGVRKQSRGMGGYLITTRWQKNFWLLA